MTTVTQPAEGHYLNVLTRRVLLRRQAYLAEKPHVTAQRAVSATASWMETEGEPLILRRARLFERILLESPVVIREGELIVGSQTQHIRGASPNVDYDPHRVIRMLEQSDIVYTKSEAELAVITEADKRALLDCAHYWEGKAPTDRMYEAWQRVFGNLQQEYQQAGLWVPAQDVPHVSVMADYGQVIDHGLESIIAQSRGKQQATTFAERGVEDYEKYCFWEAVVICCEAVIGYARRHSEEAKRLATKESDAGRKAELEEIARICDQVPAKPARNFREAVQSFWFTHLNLLQEVSQGGIYPGRMDQYFYPTYAADIQDGNITRQEAGELLALLWVKLSELDQVVSLELSKSAQASLFQWATISGVTREGEDATNDLSYLILDVTGQVRLPQPTIGIRYHNRLSTEFLIKALETNIAIGGGVPSFMNDEKVQRNFLREGVSIEDARDWAYGGCIYPYIPGCSAECGWGGDGNIAKIMELTLNDGIDPATGKRLGLAIGRAEDFTSFEALYDAFKEQMVYFIELNWKLHNLMFQVRHGAFLEPFASTLMGDCIEKGMDYSLGGIRYPYMLQRNGWGKGLVNAADSLAAVQQLVYEEKKLTMPRLMEALKANFEGHEDVQKMLLAAPKYGNDDDYADHFVNEIDLLAQRQWAKHCRFGNGGGATHYYFGIFAGALPDGRKAGHPLADAFLSPMRGADIKGPAAVINSATKVDHHELSDGDVVNMKLPIGSLRTREGKEKTLSLLKTYFDRGGWHIQFNIHDRKTLLDAQQYPAQYRDLLVRVGGFSAFFVELSAGVQNDIIGRTEHVL